MSIRRREFMKMAAALGAAAYVPGGVRRASAASTSKLRIQMGGLMAPIIKRAHGATGIPASTPRLDVLFLRASIPHTCKVSANGKDHDVRDCFIEIVPKGASLSGAVALVQNTRTQGAFAAGCPADDAEWSDLSWLMDAGRATGVSQVNPKNLCDAPNVDQVVARVTLNGGKLKAVRPEFYNKEIWTFTRGDGQTYKQTMAEQVEYTANIAATQVEVRFKAFGSAAAPDPILVPANAHGLISLSIANVVKNPDPGATESGHAPYPHFESYYDALSPRPPAPHVDRQVFDSCTSALAKLGDPYFCVSALFFDET